MTLLPMIVKTDKDTMELIVNKSFVGDKDRQITKSLKSIRKKFLKAY